MPQEQCNVPCQGEGDDADSCGGKTMKNECRPIDERTKNRYKAGRPRTETIHVMCFIYPHVFLFFFSGYVVASHELFAMVDETRGSKLEVVDLTG